MRVIDHNCPLAVVFAALSIKQPLAKPNELMRLPGSSKWSRAASRSRNTGGCAGSKRGPAGRQHARTMHVSGWCEWRGISMANSSRDGARLQLQSSWRLNRQLRSSTLSLTEHTPAAGGPHQAAPFHTKPPQRLPLAQAVAARSSGCRSLNLAPAWSGHPRCSSQSSWAAPPATAAAPAGG